jgi:hypothetical protein
VLVTADGDTLCLKPRRALDDALLARVREAKPVILEAVRNRSSDEERSRAACPSPHCAGCYDVGDGRKIHSPRCGADFLRWRAWLEGKGQRQLQLCGVEVWRGGLGGTYRLPTLSSVCLTSVALPKKVTHGFAF